MLMYQYRKLLYQNYFESQAGRRLPQEQLHLNLKREMRLFQREIIPHIQHQKSASVLDIGCGYGSLVAAFQASGYELSQGIDISPDMVNTALKLGISGITQADILPFMQQHTQAFDVITGIDIIEHFSKDELVALLQAVKMSLKPGGVAVFRTPNVDAAFFTLYSYGDFTHENYMNASAAKQVMLNCGFTSVNIYPSCMKVSGFLKEALRKISWSWWMILYKWQIFASGRSASGIIFTPNMVIVCTNS
jgi:2-polyprenyl-3-methyl-5-hydroxy-6-metoxy-1,4-benzoquinol methylase